MPRARFFRLHPHKQRDILDSATLEFAEFGLEDASLNRIIEASGVSKGAMYYYFDDKADLYTTVLRDALAQRMAVVGELFTAEIPVPDGDYWGAYEALTLRRLHWVREHPDVASIAASLLRLDPNMVAGEQLAELYGEAHAQWERFLEAGQALGAVRDDLPKELLLQVTFGMGETMDKWLFSHWEEMEDADLAPIAATMADLMRRVLEPPRER